MPQLILEFDRTFYSYSCGSRVVVGCVATNHHKQKSTIDERRTLQLIVDTSYQ